MIWGVAAPKLPDARLEFVSPANCQPTRDTGDNLARKKLPFFKWYPSDAESDERYSLSTLAALGLFHRLLNSAWVNDGLPEDIGSLTRIGRCTLEEFSDVWPFIRPLFPRGPDGRLRNARQEEERTSARKKSKANSRPNNRNAVKEQPVKAERERVFLANERVSTRASESESLSGSVSSGGMQGGIVGRAEDSFGSWWSLWSSSRGGMHRTLAEQAFVEHVPPALFLACMECTASYLTVPQDISGYRPDNFLRIHAEVKFSKRYEPVVKMPARRSFSDDVAMQLAKQGGKF